MGISSPAIGGSIGHYRILEKLGEGGMGVVYKARDTHLDRFVAIKVLPPDKVSDPNRKARFAQEARAASALNHPNIVVVHDISSANGADFIVMEYVSGKTLDQLIARKPIPLTDALRLGSQIADALARAHEAGIVHRDLKPGNVMLDEHGHIKVLDFGLAKLNKLEPVSEDEPTLTLKDYTEEGAIVGTAAYMSPEQAEGKFVDRRSDIFSFGALLYEMLTGRRAFQGDSRISTISAVLHQEPKPLADFPRDLEKVVSRCLRKDRERRFQHMDDVRVALEELKEESEVQPSQALRRSPSRRLRYVLALCVVAFLGAAAWPLWRYVGRTTPAPTLVQVTSYPGFETTPCFSPDGTQVAFVWNGENQDNADIYVKIVGETEALRLTRDPAPDVYPEWSRDGRRIAFKREGSPGIWSVSPLGGPEQKLAEVQVMAHMSWSPDGKWLAVGRGISRFNPGDVRGIWMVPIDGGDPRRITDPKAPILDIDPRFSPDGRSLAYTSCTTGYSCDIFVQPLDSGYNRRGVPRRITQQGIFIDGLDWTHDGATLVYSGSVSWGMTSRLWRIPSGGGRAPEPLEIAGFGARSPSIARVGNRLAFHRSTLNYDIWRFDIGGIPKPFLTSSLDDYTAAFSPDGSKIAFTSARSGGIIEIWLADADGSHPAQLTKGVGRGQGSPSWSPDGRSIAFDSLAQDGSSHICVIDSGGGRSRQVTSGTHGDSLPIWSTDGKSIYFSSDRTGRGEIWRVPAAGGPAEQITETGGLYASESPDGRTLYYAKSTSGPLFARSTSGGPERVIVQRASCEFMPVRDGIYYIGSIGPDRRHPVQFYSYSTGRSVPLVDVEGPLHHGISVSPDRKTILFSKAATPGADVMIVDNFR